jgi:hypothetical protein
MGKGVIIIGSTTVVIVSFRVNALHHSVRTANIFGFIDHRRHVGSGGGGGGGDK